MADEEVTLSEELYSCLRRYAESIKLSEPTFHVTRGSKKGDNYVGLIYRVRIEGVENDKKTKTVRHLILKTSSHVSGRVMEPRKLYEREKFFYQEVLPTFEETLQKHGGISELFPALYGVDDEEEALLLENLTRKGFVMKNTKILDYPHASLVIRRLGELHAYSFATRASDPIKFDRLKQMEDPLFSRLDINDPKIYPRELGEVILKALKDEDKHYTERFQRFLDNIIQHLKDATDGSLAEPYAVVNHGDAWTNNILFKYNQESQECSQEKIPCDLRFLDFQLCRYASPALDIVYTLFCSCTPETRRKYFDQLIDEYYETMSKCLKRFGYDPNVLFPYEALIQHLTKFGKYAAGMAVYVLHFIANSDVEITEIKTQYEEKLFDKKLETDNVYKSMIKGTYKDLVDRNYI